MFSNIGNIQGHCNAHAWKIIINLGDVQESGYLGVQYGRCDQRQRDASEAHDYMYGVLLIRLQPSMLLQLFIIDHSSVLPMADTG